MSTAKKKNRSKCENPRAVRMSTNVRVANASNMQLVQRVDDHVRWLKNEMSAHCHARLLELVSDPSEFKKHYARFESKFLLAWEIQQVFHAVVDGYLNTFKQRIKRKHFKVQRRFVVERYKRNGKNFRKGDIRTCRVVLGHGTYSWLVKYLCHCPDLSLDALGGTAIHKVCVAVASEKPHIGRESRGWCA